ncbi:N-acetyltransferase [uncultured Sneathiella sp.]|uniref:GNAT family N-acetyltransferase n=1 Tax=uncultured Sneathiella sp. TaxID=879315 RepID=UPI0030DBF0E0
MSLTLRDERPEDTAEIREIITAAFGQPEEADLVEALRTANDLTLSLVAEEDGKIIGHIALSRLKSPANSVALAPVSVAPDRQGGGIGGALIVEAIARADKDGEALIFVLGDPAYYTRFGFSVGTAAPFDCIYAGEYFMALELGEGKVAVEPVVYADAFGRLG